MTAAVRRALAVAAALLLAGCALAPSQAVVMPITPPATPGNGSPLPATSTLGVSGRHLLRNGAPFVPKGLTLVGFESPYPALQGDRIAARDAFGPDELAAARGYGADTIRFLVGQQALTPPIGDSGATFRRSLRDAVVNARAEGFVVVIALEGSFDGSPAPPPAMPDPSTLQAWTALAPLFASDDGVAYEVFNAPAAPATTDNWSAWADGGAVAGDAGVVGMQQVIDAIRATGAPNVVIADGLDHGHTLEGAPVLRDTQGAVVYGVEPYPRSGDSATTWDTDFGTLAASRPVLVTEWDAPSVPPAGTDIPQSCDAGTPQHARDLLDYLAFHAIGIVGYAFDLTDTLVSNLSWAMTSYDNFACGVAGDGPGRLLYDHFTAGRAGAG